MSEVEGMDLVDLIDCHQCSGEATAFYGKCVECFEEWPCWTVRVVHHAFGLGHSQGVVDTARFEHRNSPTRRLLTCALVQLDDDNNPFPSLDAETAIREPTWPPTAAAPVSGVAARAKEKGND